MDSLTQSNLPSTPFGYTTIRCFVEKQLQDVRASLSGVEFLPHPISRGLHVSLTIFRCASSASVPADGPQPLSR
jgi:hypothetical protein